MPSDPVEQTKQVKAASDIVAVVGSYLALHPAGKVFKAICPFHADSRPSLDIDPARQRYKCWSCGAHGDVFAFVMHQEKVGFKEARAILANKVGIKLDEQASPQDHHRARLLEVMRWAQGKYAYQLLEGDTGEAARKYLGERKLSGKTVRDFGLGFAPLAGDWLARLAAAERIPDETLVEVGLTAFRDGQRGQYDRFRDRVMFPIKDVRGQVVGFGGRIMPNSPYATRAPKYYNSAETPLFSKSELLYGLDLARHGGAAAGYLAVVEGYTDVMMAHQCGVPQVVATMGTALNKRHVNQLSRFVKKVVLVFDSDSAGDKAWYKGMEELLAVHEVEIAIATLPQGMDPCDLLSQPNGAEAFRKALAGATNALDYRLDWLLQKYPTPNIEETSRILDDILRVIAITPFARSTASQVKEELIVTRLSHRLGLKQETVWTRLGELKKDHEKKERDHKQKEHEQEKRNPKPVSGFVELRPDAVMPTTERPAAGKSPARRRRPSGNWWNCCWPTRPWCRSRRPSCRPKRFRTAGCGGFSRNCTRSTRPGQSPIWRPSGRGSTTARTCSTPPLISCIRSAN